MTPVQLPLLSTAPQVVGFDPATQAIFAEMYTQWSAKMPRNIERQIYLDMKSKIRDLKVSLPPSLVNELEVVMGWAEKAVFELANRIVFERWVSEDGGDDPFGIASVFDDNRMQVEFPQAVASSLSQSVAFGTVTTGDSSAGEPDPLMMFHSALWATGRYNRRRRGLDAGMLISEVDGLGRPTEITILLPRLSIIIGTDGTTWTVRNVVANRLDRPAITMLPFRPTLERPFGRSRVDRRVMSLIDRGVRNSARLEMHAEMFSSLKLILMGADEDTFKDAAGNTIPLWSFYMGRLNTLTKDEDGDLPKLEQVAAESPEPHIAVMRQITAEFSGHTGVPLGSLGVATDNPESAGAKQEARQDIIGDAENQHVIYGLALKEMAGFAYQLRNRTNGLPEGFRTLQPKWRPPSTPTLSAIADAGAKRIAAVPDLAQTDVGLELLGLDGQQITRVRADLRRTNGAARLDGLRDAAQAAQVQGAAAPPAATEASGVDEATALKAKFDALGVAVRAGVDPKDAADRLGLTGVKFTGAVPVSLRLPESDAGSLEEK